MNGTPFTETELDQLSALFARLSVAVGFGSNSERIAAKSAMGGALFVCRMRFDSDAAFISFAGGILGIGPEEAADLITHAVGDSDDGNDTLNTPSAIDV